MTRELGTLKAIGWPGRRVVGQVTGESLSPGRCSAASPARCSGSGAPRSIGAIGPTLTATVAAPEAAGRVARAARHGRRLRPGRDHERLDVVCHSTRPSTSALIVLAISLALLGGLIAGSVGGLRAARLRPAAALRTLD